MDAPVPPHERIVATERTQASTDHLFLVQDDGVDTLLWGNAHAIGFLDRRADTSKSRGDVSFHVANEILGAVGCLVAKGTCTVALDALDVLLLDVELDISRTLILP